MRIRLLTKMVWPLIFCILVICCTSCKKPVDNQVESSIPTPGSSSSPGVVPTPITPESSSISEIEVLSPEQVMENKIIGRVSGFGYVSKSEQEFLEDYNAFFSEEETSEPSELLMDTYASCSKVQVELLNDDTALVHIDVPNLPKILKSAISSLSDGERSAGNVSCLIQTAAREILLSGDFERKTSDVTVSCTLSEDGTFEIVESFEYLDALYGGILTSTGDFFAQTEEQVADEETEVAE